MASRTQAPINGNDSTLVTILAGAVVAMVLTLVVGGYWLQQQRADEALLLQQAQVYENYLFHTRPPAQAPELPRSFIEAQQTRQQLLDHPAVTPGAGFDAPGVQATGKAIVDAIDQAKRL